MPPGCLPGYFFETGALVGKSQFIFIQTDYNHTMFLPTTIEEVREMGWDDLEVILVTGDSYIDSPFIGTALIGKVLVKAGYRVGSSPSLTRKQMRTSGGSVSRGCSGG